MRDFRDLIRIAARLDEAPGVKKYRDRTFWDVMSDFKAAGGEFLGQGKYASVIGHPKWPHVYKFFADDDCYLKFVEEAMKHPHPGLPRFLAAPRQVIPFYLRHKSETKLWLVKMERLEPCTDPWFRTNCERVLINADNYLGYITSPEQRAADAEEIARMGERIKELDKERKWTDPELVALENRWSQMKNRQLHAEGLNEFVDHFPRFPEFLHMMAEHLPKLKVQCEPDWHWENIMIRPATGEFVLVDPYWHGTNPLADHYAMMRAEYDYYSYEDEDDQMVRGGETELRTPKRQPEPPETTGSSFDTDLDDEDVPF